MSTPLVLPDAECTSDLNNITFVTLVAELGLEDTLQLFSGFFNEAEKRLRRLRELSYENWEGIEREAHGLKGAAGNFGLDYCSELAAVLELDARTVTAESYEAAISGLESSYAAARQQFMALAG